MAEAGDQVPADELVYLDFAEQLDQAEAEAESTIVGNLAKLSATSPQAALGFLRLRWPDRWHEQPHEIEMSGPQGGPVPLVPALAVMTDEQLRAHAAALEREIRAEADESG